jgi:hypothetical protein
MITYVITPLHSRRDRNGNCYWGFNALNTINGKSIDGSISGGESNVNASMLYLSEAVTEVPWDIAKQSVSMLSPQEMPIRAFDRRFKPSACDYAGCLPQEIAAFIKKHTD